MRSFPRSRGGLPRRHTLLGWIAVLWPWATTQHRPSWRAGVSRSVADWTTAARAPASSASTLALAQHTSVMPYGAWPGQSHDHWMISRMISRDTEVWRLPAAFVTGLRPKIRV